MLVLVAAAIACGHAWPGQQGQLARPGVRRASGLARTSATASALVPAPGRSMLQVRITGVGAAAPGARTTNSDLESVVETSDEWIAKRTGIKSRHLLSAEGSISALSVAAARGALESAGVAAEEVDLVILATSSPDDLFGDAAMVASEIGAVRAVGFDLTAACSGFLFAVVTASQFVHTGAYRTVLVVGADALSRWVDWEDRNTCILFGDGAGAVLIRAAEPGGAGAAQGPGLLGFELRSDGSGRSDLNLGYVGQRRVLSEAAGTVSTGSYGSIAMNGKEVYKFACSKVPEVLEQALQNAGMTADDIDHLLLHQANIRIIEAVASRLGIPASKIITNLSEYGNTSAASIPLALNEAIKSGAVKPGDVIACAGFGAGLSWGAAIFRWG